MRKLLIVLVFAGFIMLPSQADARVAVTISLEAGPAFTEDNLETVDIIVPERPAEAMPLQVGDRVFFEALEPFLEGVGTITNIYDTEDPAINEALILDLVYQE